MKKRRMTEMLKMKQIKEILRLSYNCNLNQTQISESCNVSRATVQDYLRRAKAVGITIEDLDSLKEGELETRLGKKQYRTKSHADLDYQKLERELCKPGVTKALLWEEYIAQNPGGHCYSGFCSALRQWKKDNRLSMRQQHKAGEKLYVDYAGQTIPIYSKTSNEVVLKAQIFVAVLGASNFTFAEATASQEIKHWIGSHVRCFEYLGGTPEVVVPDNLKSGVTKAVFYDPQLNPKYRDLAEHYAIAVLPARSKKPKDKSKVEVGVQIVERWILAALRNRKFYSLAELNSEISLLLEKINSRKMKTYGCSRKEMFASIDRPVLAALPQKPYQFFDYKLARVNIDYHIEVDNHFYSVPYQLRQKEVEIRIREQVIEVIHSGKRVA